MKKFAKKKREFYIVCPSFKKGQWIINKIDQVEEPIKTRFFRIQFQSYTSWRKTCHKKIKMRKQMLVIINLWKAHMDDQLERNFRWSTDYFKVRTTFKDRCTKQIGDWALATDLKDSNNDLPEINFKTLVHAPWHKMKDIASTLPVFSIKQSSIILSFKHFT